jgi:nucleotidyltransferase substrate binding protein (TIGR01987 family)
VALDLSAFRSALASLRKAVTRSQAEPADDEVRDSVIQRFEYTYELAWKTLKHYLAQEGVSEVTLFSQRDLYREAAARGLLEDPVVWFGYQRARNETSHTYNADKAREVHARAIVSCDDAETGERMGKVEVAVAGGTDRQPRDPALDGRDGDAGALTVT